MLPATLFKHSKIFPNYFSSKCTTQCKVAQQMYELGHLTTVHHLWIDWESLSWASNYHWFSDGYSLCPRLRGPQKLQCYSTLLSVWLLHTYECVAHKHGIKTSLKLCIKTSKSELRSSRRQVLAWPSTHSHVCNTTIKYKIRIRGGGGWGFTLTFLLHYFKQFCTV